uniref:DUF4283 domain-containing protein n=1 Tax=Oryza brachyantha TaxID=4533 RepID=J3N5B1_ORYBR
MAGSYQISAAYPAEFLEDIRVGEPSLRPDCGRCMVEASSIDDFLITFRHVADKELVRRCNQLPCKGVGVSFRPWTRLCGGTSSKVQFFTKLSPDGLPTHLWGKNVVIWMVIWRRSSLRNARCLGVFAWFKNPSALPLVAVVEVPEKPGAGGAWRECSGTTVAPPRTPRCKPSTEFNILVHVEEVIDPTPQHWMGDRLDDGSGDDEDIIRRNAFDCWAGRCDGTGPFMRRWAVWVSRGLDQRMLPLSSEPGGGSACGASGALWGREGGGVGGGDKHAGDGIECAGGRDSYAGDRDWCAGGWVGSVGGGDRRAGDGERCVGGEVGCIGGEDRHIGDGERRAGGGVRCAGGCRLSPRPRCDGRSGKGCLTYGGVVGDQHGGQFGPGRRLALHVGARWRGSLGVLRSPRRLVSGDYGATGGAVFAETAGIAAFLTQDGGLGPRRGSWEDDITEEHAFGLGA